MDTSVKYFQWRCHNRYVSKVDVWSCTKYSDWFHRKNQVVMHSTLSHDFFYDNDFLLTRSSYLIECLCIYYKAFVFYFLQSFTDFLCDHVCCRMCSKRTRSFHVGSFFDDNFCLDEDFTFIRSSRTSPHDIFIQVSFGRTEFTNLNTIVVCSGNHHDNAIKYSCCTCTDFVFALFCSDRLYVHDCIRISMVLIRCNDINL